MPIDKNERAGQPMPGVNDIPKFLETMSLLVSACRRWGVGISASALGIAAAFIATGEYPHHEAY
jgi:hypothetical protein